MLEYDPRKRLTATQALEHEYFRLDPLPGRNALVPTQPGEKAVNYPTRPVDTTTDFEGTTSIQPPQQISSGNAVPGSMSATSMVSARTVPRPMPMVGMARMAGAGMPAFNMASQAGMALNPAGLPMQRGAASQPHQQQLRRRDPGMGMQNPGYPQQKRRL
ncbi:cyclin-dependent kinase E-1 [Iris pallida]|uniref:Cyclin-dependent kinase E-1 n=1 Tax=Iris pallida TaxID=29817 RepID=A0AAX6FDL1_IRIPA|nr:cyclin-dependent kinase E-1 [Iris pallida]